MYKYSGDQGRGDAAKGSTPGGSMHILETKEQFALSNRWKILQGKFLHFPIPRNEKSSRELTYFPEKRMNDFVNKPDTGLSILLVSLFLLRLTWFIIHLKKCECVSFSLCKLKQWQTRQMKNKKYSFRLYKLSKTKVVSRRWLD